MAGRKFKLTDETKINWLGKKLFRIEATVDIPSKNVKKGDKGGWLESEEVNGNARVSGDAWVFGNAEVSGDARVFGDARVSGNAWVFGNARVSGDAWVTGDARVFGDARVSGDAWVFGDAQISLKRRYTQGGFIHSSDNQILPTVVDQEGEADFNNNSDYRYLLVIGDYKIEDIVEQPKTTNPPEITFDGATYVLKESVKGEK